MLRFGTFLGGASAVIFGFGLLGLGQYLMMGYVSAIFTSVTLYGGLVLMSGLVAYDTQRILEDYRAGQSDVLRDSMDVFLNFIGIFRRLLVILLMRED
mmetsp:Transcript_9525/g.28828  ORF Transcript_9525/g.28828 Transcript_9525/m.28828 type:complete len:98 (+) Transcript_9525:140-433(+)